MLQGAKGMIADKRFNELELDDRFGLLVKWSTDLARKCQSLRIEMGSELTEADVDDF